MFSFRGEKIIEQEQAKDNIDHHKNIYPCVAEKRRPSTAC
jgi:hypothetical protein